MSPLSGQVRHQLNHALLIYIRIKNTTSVQHREFMISVQSPNVRVRFRVKIRVKANLDVQIYRADS